VFVEEAQREEELGSMLADIITHLVQDMSICNSLLLSYGQKLSNLSPRCGD
jgi:hypothetical protein